MSCKLTPGAVHWLLGLDIEEFMAALLLLQKIMDEGLCPNCALSFVHGSYHALKALKQEEEKRLQWHFNN